MTLAGACCDTMAGNSPILGRPDQRNGQETEPRTPWNPISLLHLPAAADRDRDRRLPGDD